jgi:hypothetical protein
MTAPTNPTGTGLHHRLTDTHGDIDTNAWNYARAAQQTVGHCRQPGCGGDLRIPPTGDDSGSHIPWFEATCDTCGHIVACPAGRALPKSGRRLEMPGGAWERRTTHLNEQKAG